ncbi:hydroxymethylpyrimidine/phosphomethylpyrimidine kinase [Sediminibacterium soli]|uniref:hydroxymethylpyrimidine/phosphomethylpyrimidine kinase n=1 Tax=Sediminibacterium soli TaxID=2698829 RepID=UPI00137B63C8|nr:hydroxymethylpyrimidine/phosphomethylpyrimidine kinase [Sediminibacterium soli]NCI46415.1 hydroxymethylpyrimidine/phosphomethylpyrimidine kinase [Sediminibacterium soli]
MSIGGIDPCGGAGLFADIKTFEQHKVYGLAVPTAITLQTEESFHVIRWENQEAILQAIEVMCTHYRVEAVKIGIVENLKSLFQIVTTIRRFHTGAKIIVDPVIRSSTGFPFWEKEAGQELLCEIFKKIDLLTPNCQELVQLENEPDTRKAAKKIADYCNVLLKGGHNPDEPGVDYLFTRNSVSRLLPISGLVFPKHGSGCVLASSITANLAIGYELTNAVRNAKKYTESFLVTNPSLLGYHA